MNNKTFFTIVGIIFALIFAAHLLRVILQWEAEIGGVVMPFWASWIALLVAGYLAVSAVRLRKV